jgi:hypothetical protein
VLLPLLLVEEMEQLLGQLRETRLWEKEGKGAPAGMGQRLLVKERLLLAGEGRRRCWNRLEREKENLPWPAEEKTKSNQETGGGGCPGREED